MKIAVLKEIAAGESRVAVVPDSAGRLRKKGHAVSVESGAGLSAGFRDEEYRQAGAEIVSSRKDLLAGASATLSIHGPSDEEIERMAEGSLLICLLYALLNPEKVRRINDRKISLISLELIPRTTLAQTMDVLSSQASCAGYWAAVHAATLLPKFFPMLMTAAGMVHPARVVVVGAGVAGLQAIATCRRLGALVEAFDVRAAAKQEVESLGAKFIEVDGGQDFSGEGGYAREVTEEYRRRQAEALAKALSRADVCITTALLPGRKAPVILTEEMVKGMRPGSVIVDLAAEQGGNCALTEAGKEVVKHGVLVSGPLHVPRHLAADASRMFSRNLENLLGHITAKDGTLKLDMSDEIIRGCVVCRGGEVVHPQVKEALR